MNSEGKSKYSFRNTVKSYETDALGRISFANILYNFQEAANHHASLMDWGLEYLNSINKFWVLSRLKLQIYQYPQHKNDIEIETWSRGAEGFFAYRDYRILLNGECCMNAVTSWMILDKNTHRPCRIEQLGKEIHTLYHGEPEQRERDLQVQDGVLRVNFIFNPATVGTPTNTKPGINLRFIPFVNLRL